MYDVLIFHVAGTFDHFEAPKQIQCVRGWRRVEPQYSRTIHNIPSKSSLGKTNNLSHFDGSYGRLHLKNYTEAISTYHIIRVSCRVIFLGMHALGEEQNCFMKSSWLLKGNHGREIETTGGARQPASHD